MQNPFDEKRLYVLSKDLLNGHYQGTPRQRLDDLIEVLRYHEWKYAVENNPVIADVEFDQLFQQLSRLENENPQLITAASPTQRVSSDLIESFEAVPHLSPMLSLANSYSAEDLESFHQSVVKLLGTESTQAISYSVEPKFDGGTVVLLYENDHLTRAATRGDGRQGDEITANVRTLRSVPLYASFSQHGIKRCELRGEAIIRKDTFEEINHLRGKKELPLFANPRNAATGGLRMKNPREAANRGMEVFIFQMAFVEYTNNKEQINSHWEHLNLLSRLGFKVPNKERLLTTDISDVARFAQAWEEKRDGYDYEIDGMVVKVNDLTQQVAIGATSHHPRWAMAYKFRARQATSTLLRVDYQVGKVGSITPVAKLEPVQVAGVTVSSVSLHNEDFILERDLHIGDQVLVERAGDVIPYIVKAFPELRSGQEVKITFPRTCPLNEDEEMPLVRADQEAAWRCPTCTCGAQQLQKLIFHVSKPAMNIDGFGRSIVERFYDLGWLKSLSDIYHLDFEQVQALEGFGVKSAQKLESAIAKASQNPIHRLLHSLSIHHLGQRAAKILAAQVEHVLDLQTLSVEELTNFNDIGPVLAENVVAYFRNDEHIADLKKMEAAGVNLRRTEEDQPHGVGEGKLSGKTILFTGTLPTLTRDQAKRLAEQNGARILSGVSGKLDILVAGEKAGSKLKKAEALGSVQIVDEAAFRDMVDQ